MLQQCVPPCYKFLQPNRNLLCFLSARAFIFVCLQYLNVDGAMIKHAYRGNKRSRDQVPVQRKIFFPMVNILQVFHVDIKNINVYVC